MSLMSQPLHKHCDMFRHVIWELENMEQDLQSELWVEEMRAKLQDVIIHTHVITLENFVAQCTGCTFIAQDE